jgi:hyperosmotically inducible protein
MNSSQRFTLIVAGALFAVASALAQSTANSPARPNTPENQPQPSSTHSPTAVPSHSKAPESEQTSKTSDKPVADAWITTKVKSELATTKDVKSMDISVKTIDGVVHLSGTQPNDMAVKKAIATAKGIKGVQRVDSSDLKSQNQSTRQ